VVLTKTLRAHSFLDTVYIRSSSSSNVIIHETFRTYIQ